MSFCEGSLRINHIVSCQVMTYAGQLLKRLVWFTWFAILMFCFRKYRRAAIWLFFFKLIIICRALWAKRSAHTWKLASWVRQWPQWYLYVSRLWFANWNVDICRKMASLTFFVFVILSLAWQTHFLFRLLPLSMLLSSELYYLVTSEEAKFHVLTWQELSTYSKCVTSCIFLPFSPWVMKYPHVGETMSASLESNSALCNWAAVSSVIEGHVISE